MFSSCTCFRLQVLISTYWNVNCGGFFSAFFIFSSFNLNLLECKYEQTESLLLGSLVLISTYWNVNLFSYQPLFSPPVLISTYWNVNYITHFHSLYVFKVLISTYWNVNFSYSSSSFTSMCFNLNLLECKCNCWFAQSSILRVLISTYWNVNQHLHSELLRYMSVLISTYWNVNFLCLHLYHMLWLF